MFDLLATTDFTFDGREYKTGDALRVSSVVALALTYQKKAIFADKTATPEPAKRRRRTYRRRDMTAESA